MDELYLRRSVRSYLDKPVEKEKLLDVLQAGTCAPSAMNNKDRQFTAISNKEILGELNAAIEGLLDSSFVERIKGRTCDKFNFF